MIKIRAVGVNPTDHEIADGEWKGRIPATFPLILGADLARVVEAAGEQTTCPSSADELLGRLLIPPLGSVGTYAEQVAVGEDAPLARLPWA